MDEQTTNNQITVDGAENQIQPTKINDTNQIIQGNDELNKKMEAILAMEGEEGKIRRERAEKEKKEMEMVGVLEEEKNKIQNELAEIEKEKEDLELKWIDLSDKKNALQKLLEPIILAESKTEKDVQAKNQEEHATDVPETVQSLEKERHILEEERQKLEKEKWVIEDKISELNTLMTENKSKYQKLLDQEYILIDKTKEITEKIKSIKVV